MKLEAPNVARAWLSCNMDQKLVIAVRFREKKQKIAEIKKNIKDSIVVCLSDCPALNVCVESRCRPVVDYNGCHEDAGASHNVGEAAKPGSRGFYAEYCRCGTLHLSTGG